MTSGTEQGSEAGRIRTSPGPVNRTKSRGIPMHDQQSGTCKLGEPRANPLIQRLLKDINLLPKTKTFISSSKPPNTSTNIDAKIPILLWQMREKSGEPYGVEGSHHPLSPSTHHLFPSPLAALPLATCPSWRSPPTHLHKRTAEATRREEAGRGQRREADLEAGQKAAVLRHVVGGTAQADAHASHLPNPHRPWHVS